MTLKQLALLLCLPLLVTACDSQQPTYSAANANSAPPAVEAPPPVVQVPPPAAAVSPAKPATTMADVEPEFGSTAWLRDPKNRWYQAPAGKLPQVAKLNVGSCDDFIERFRTCFNSGAVPRDQKFLFRREFNQHMREWKTDTAAGKISQVASSCVDAERKARNDMAKFGCKTF